MYSGTLAHEGASGIPISPQTHHIRSKTDTSPDRKQHVSSNAGVCAYMGLAPIVEETESTKSSSPYEQKRTSITRFPKNGPMKHYQRFVTNH